MAEPLKRFFDRRRVEAIAHAIRAVYPAFDTRAFVAAAVRGFPRQELLERGEAVARALRTHLPGDVETALALLVRSLGPPLPEEADGLEVGTDAGIAGQGMAPFHYLPHVAFVRAYGLEHFEASMRAQHALTRRFSAEWSIRPFLEREPDRTLAVLQAWAVDPSCHVRRLVSEGTRPRLPWAPRLRAFADDPRRVLALLERLVDDPTEYVRRSVANHLNDVSKDHPALALEVARRWLGAAGAGEPRRRLVRHALRSLVKAGHAEALALLGFGGRPRVRVRAEIAPRRVKVGGAVTVRAVLRSTVRERQALVVDLAVHFVKASGATRPKVFKVREVSLAPGASVEVGKRISLAQMTTRVHRAGLHRVELLVNGIPFPAGAFHVVAAAPVRRAASRRLRPR